MSRPILHLDAEDLPGLVEAPFEKPARLVFPNPRRGGPLLVDLRAVISPKGHVRYSATPAAVFVDFDPGPREPLRVALNTIVRNDAAGLERMLLSVLPHVDEIVLGVDGRSDEETLKVARAYADCVYVFPAAAIGMSEEDWKADKIHFANARNLGRKRVQSLWTLVIDSDEYLHKAADFRKLVDEAGDLGAYSIDVQIGTTFVMKEDQQRFARTEYRWTSNIHNQLIYDAPIKKAEDAYIISDPTLRAIAEHERRHAQRDMGIEELVEEAAKGEITALFHLVKHKAARGKDMREVVRLAEDYRSRIEPHSVLVAERVWVALGVAFRYYNDDNLPEADRWAVRALLDGPHTTAFCLLGDIAEQQGDLWRALGWYECACARTEPDRLNWPGVTELRFGRLAGLRKAIANPDTAPVVLIEEVEAVNPSA